MTPAPQPQTPAAAEPRPLRQVRDLTLWVGAGRPLTQTGRIRLADARELVARLDTGDELDPVGFRTASSAELPGLTLVVEWAKACRLVRVRRGRLERVKRHAHLLDAPDELWTRMFEAFGRLGDALCPDGWAASPLREHFQPTLEAVLLHVHASGGTLARAEAYALAWHTVADRFLIRGAPEQHVKTWRAMNDRDMGCALGVLQELGALRGDAAAVSLTERGRRAMRAAAGDASPGDAVLQLKITLRGVSDPPVWRRVLVPAAIKLDRLHEVVQAAMGWYDCHLHAFSADGVDYGLPDRELGFRDERRTPLSRVLARAGDRVVYTYDFGDDWQHEVRVEKVLAAAPGARYPSCVAGRGARPPEDCGGPWGYARLRAALADPRDEEHEQLLAWLGLERPEQFDPRAFDLDVANGAL